MLTAEQIKAISGILADLGQVAVASVVIPFVVPQFTLEAMNTIVLGSFLALFFWTLSVLSIKSL